MPPAWARNSWPAPWRCKPLRPDEGLAPEYHGTSAANAFVARSLDPARSTLVYLSTYL
jgi:hypothetical protein